VTPNISIGYIPSQPAKIRGWHKDKQSLAQNMTVEEANDVEDDNATSRARSLVFDKVQPSGPQYRPSVFSKMGKILYS